MKLILIIIVSILLIQIINSHTILNNTKNIKNVITNEHEIVTPKRFQKYFEGICKGHAIKPDHISECMEPTMQVNSAKDHIEAGQVFDKIKEDMEFLNKNLTKEFDVQCKQKKNSYDYFKSQANKKDDHKGHNNKPNFLQKSLETELPKNTKGKKKKDKINPAPKQIKKFGHFHDIHTRINRISSSFSSMFKTSLSKKTDAFMKCYSTATKVPTLSNY